MYTRQFFVEQFRETDTEELLGRFATADLTDEAKDAILSVLRERGITDKEVTPLALEAKKAGYRRTSPTNECDYCGRTGRSVKDQGQKFCSTNCLRNARLMEASVDIPEQEILKHATELKNGTCPSCRGRESKIELRKYYWVWSALFITQWGTSSKVCCKKCGTKSNLLSIISCMLLGWWGIPWGIVKTPVQITSNIAAMFRRFDKSKPSEELIQAARLQLAEVLLGQQTGKPNTALNPDAQKQRAG